MGIFDDLTSIRKNPSSRASKKLLESLERLAEIQRPDSKREKQKQLLRVLEAAARDKIRLRQLEGQIARAVAALLDASITPTERRSKAYRALTIDPVLGEFIAQSKAPVAS